MSLTGMLRRRLPAIVALTVLGVLGAAVALKRTEPTYSSSAQLILVANGASNVLAAEEGQVLTQQAVLSLVELVPDEPVIVPVLQELHLPYTARQLESEISVNSPLDTTVIDIAVKDRNQQRATLIAGAVALQFAKYVSALQLPGKYAAAVLVARVTQPASPQGRVSPKAPEYIAVGLLVGLLLGLTLAVVLERLDDRIDAADELAAASRLPILVEVPRLPRGARPTGATALAFGPDREVFRQLRLAVGGLGSDVSGKSLAITSPGQSEGRTTTAIGLASAFAEAGFRVLLIEADGLRPAISSYLGLESRSGLLGVLAGTTDVGAAAIVIEQLPGLLVLPYAGTGDARDGPSPIAVEDLQRCLRDASELADVLVVDCPPVLATTNAVSVAALVDGVLLLGRYRKTTRRAVDTATALLDQVSARLIGSVLTQIPERAMAREPHEFGRARPWRDDVSERLV
jgi:polysaccharide biosynthesis transport protein